MAGLVSWRESCGGKQIEQLEGRTGTHSWCCVWVLSDSGNNIRNFSTIVILSTHNPSEISSKQHRRPGIERSVRGGFSVGFFPPKCILWNFHRCVFWSYPSFTLPQAFPNPLHHTPPTSCSIIIFYSPLSVNSAVDTCTGVWGYPLAYTQPTVGLRKATLLPLAASSSSVRGGA